jgi:integrase/recombinase XerD
MDKREVLDKMKQLLDLMNYARSSKKAYMGYIARYLDYCLTTNIQDREEKIYTFLLEKVQGSDARKIALAAIKFLYKRVLKIELPKMDLKIRKKRRLPKFLTENEVISVLNAIRNKKHRSMIAIMYGSGLRLSEVVALRVEHILWQDDMIRIQQSKGNKDRYTILPGYLKAALEGFCRDKAGSQRVFTSGRGKPYSPRTIQKIVEYAGLRAGIGRQVTPHMMRHSFATHALNNGVSIRLLQELLGHKSLDTTCIYTHVMKPDIQRITSPLDRISEKNNPEA